MSQKEGFFSSELLLSASVLFLPVVYMTAALALLSRLGLGLWVFPTGLLLWGTAVATLHREEGWQKLAATLSLFLAAFALAAFLASLTLDGGSDSRAYHARAILGLLKGINPYWEPVGWVSHSYPAAHWLLSASLIVWTKTFTASFAFTLVAVFAAFLCSRRFLACLPCLSRAKSRFWRHVLAFLLAVNPIATWCFFTHHTDGLLVSTLLSAFMLMLCFVSEDGASSRTTRMRMFFCLAVLLVFLVNIKFTGLVFGGILGVTVLAYGIRREASRKTLLRLAGLGSGAAILGVVLFGFYPYATNIAQDKNPFHPAVKFHEEGNLKDVLADMFKPKFYKESYYEKWWISQFSTHGSLGAKPVSLPPFSSLSSLSFLRGFGSLFSGSLLLCLTLVFFVRHRGAWLVLAGVMASVLSTSASVLFRLTPQNWWLPLLFLVFLLAPDKEKTFLSRAQRVVVFVVVACLLYSSLRSVGIHAKRFFLRSQVVRQAEQQGGWFVVPDTNIKNPAQSRLFNYYQSGLSGVRLPLREECPEKAERRKPIYGLMLCKP